MTVRIFVALWVLATAGVVLAQPGTPTTEPSQPATRPSIGSAPSGSASARRSRELFIEAWEVVRDHFYDARMHAVDWEAVRDELSPAATRARGRTAISSVINQALDRLSASHTRHYTPDQREYYELLDVFYPDGVPRTVDADFEGRRITYTGIGLVAQPVDGRWHVYDVYPGGPADEAGVHVGDELVAVEGSGGPLGPLGTTRRDWADVSPFRGRIGLPTTAIVRRGMEAEPMEIRVTPRRIQPRQMFIRALEKSARVLERDGRRLAHVQVRSYAHPDYQEALLELIRTKFRGCDGLILDLRGGWGGARAEYLAAFNPTGAAMDWRERDDEEWKRGDAPWSGPMVVLIDRGTRSGKEMLAHAMKSRGRAHLVGERTAGAVLGGRPFILSDQSLLIVAVSDVKVDGVRLEGVGVAPDVEVKRDLAYCDGRDEQLDAGVAELVSVINRPAAR